MPQGSVNTYSYAVEGGGNKWETNVPSQKLRVFVAFVNENTSFQAMKPPCTCLVPFHQGQSQGNHRFTNKSLLTISQSRRRLEIGFRAPRGSWEKCKYPTCSADLRYGTIILVKPRF